MLAIKIKKSTDIAEINQYASEIIELVKQAKLAGIHMENRLQVYHNGIESMGFVRKKRKKYPKKIRR
jgi:hypothetical protein